MCCTHDKVRERAGAYCLLLFRAKVAMPCHRNARRACAIGHSRGSCCACISAEGSQNKGAHSDAMQHTWLQLGYAKMYQPWHGSGAAALRQVAYCLHALQSGCWRQLQCQTHICQLVCCRLLLCRTSQLVEFEQVQC